MAERNSCSTCRNYSKRQAMVQVESGSKEADRLMGSLGRTVPSTWKEAIIIPILKPSKDASIPSNCRPISLTSCICKLEKIINLRLIWLLEMENRRHVLAIFFDLEKAYNATWKHGIFIKVYNIGLTQPPRIYVVPYCNKSVGNTACIHIFSTQDHGYILPQKMKITSFPIFWSNPTVFGPICLFYDSRLTWVPHIKQLKAKAKIALIHNKALRICIGGFQVFTCGALMCVTAYNSLCAITIPYAKICGHVALSATELH
ncbi:uncharacterized protein LOC134783562 [Penaeus indicus]|uniref:uncharacterized protein LOC134783562 n=1 Tax=Penaeus indicus TaxID=29960 RepID=UPI00300D61F0